MSEQEKQCRICLDGVEAEKEVGRLIRPCLCRGSISYVHIGCLQRWRNESTSNSAFFQCPQCRYQYRFARTRIVGLATNPIAIGAISALLFTCIVMMASFVTTFFMSAFEEPSNQSYYGFYSYWYISPFQVAQDLVTAAFRVIRDGDLSDVLEDAASFTTAQGSIKMPAARAPPGIVKRFIRRFLLGLPLIGAGSVVQMLVSVQALAPVQWLARYRGSRDRRNSNSRDIAALIVIGLLLVGAFRALFKVYHLTESITKRVLLRAEESILEVN
ncbi:hypothetical protein HYPSUDRAFT_127596 [Hypholoma sublateritium FD-334 SS-4]|uniref:Uncharacterized protein n=1 Tax=Hypholoma sublateritium (strain FD-334 SS-4) TaxID=945553 RepID=A0A0D2PF67_HYPSF|nr:hypothetical protein HYPSUDRAFT_127596 [Hypholoma sublateritium FD-334 SS-4]